MADQDGSNEESAPVPLLEALRRLPAAYRNAPIIWVPRSVSQQVGSILRQLLDDACKCANAMPGDTAAESAHLLLRNAPQLLLRSLPSDEHQQGECGGGFAAVIRSRLALARAGKWEQLIEEYFVESSQTVTAQRVQSTGAEEDLSPASAQAAALRARTGSLRGAAAILLGGVSVPPGEQTDAAIKELFHANPRSDEEVRDLQQALSEVDAIPRKKMLKVTLRMTGRHVASMKPAAGPGGSGWRNSHVQCIYSDAAGPSSITAWAQLWAHGLISPWLSVMWTGALARPFWKDEHRRKIRPVLCGEVLLKTAMGIIVRGAEKQLGAGYGERQYGAGFAGGAPTEIAEVRAAAAAYPDRAIVTLDTKNAFGEVTWPIALRAALERAPKLAIPMAAMWRCGHALVYTMTPSGTGWHAFPVHGSLVQGNLEGAPAFCLVIACVQLEVEKDPRLAGWRTSIRHWQYIDDWVIQCPLEALHVLLTVAHQKLQASSLPLQHTKCAFHVPAFAGRASDDSLPLEVAQCAETIAYEPDGVTLLGTDACREQSAPLHVSGVLPVHTQRRLSKAVRLAERVQDMIRLAPPAGAKQPGFAIARCLIAHALDYDACVVPCSLLLPHAGVVDKAVLDVATLTLDEPDGVLPPQVLQQLVLPQRLGGLQLDLPSRLIPLARAAHLVERGPHLRTQITAWAAVDQLPAGKDVTDFDGVGSALADGIMTMLEARGVPCLSGTGQPCRRQEAVLLQQMLRPSMPDKHLLSAFLKRSAEVGCAELMESSSADDRVRLHSAGGRTAGTSLVAPLSMAGTQFPDWQWTSALRWRLGLPRPGPVGVCRNERRDGEPCGEALDLNGDHAVECPCGPLCKERHDGLSDIYADVVEEAGGLARREAFIAELSSGQEAWLDVWGHGVLEAPDILLDITVRHPRASRYRPLSENEPGSAAAKAEKEKADRYPSASGRHVIPVAHETWGRLGSQAEQFLDTCASAAQRRAHRRCRVSGGEGRRWRARLDGALHRAVAMQQASGQRGLPGRRRQRQRPLDLSSLDMSCDV